MSNRKQHEKFKSHLDNSAFLLVWLAITAISTAFATVFVIGLKSMI